MRDGLHGRRGPLASCGLTSGGGGRSCGGVPVPRRQVAFPWGLLAAHLLQLHKRCAVRSPPIPAAASALVRGPVISIFFQCGPQPEQPEGGRIHPPQNTERLKALCMAQPFTMNSSLTVVADVHLAVSVCQALFLPPCTRLSPWWFISFLKVFVEFVTILLLFYVFWPRGMWGLSSPTRDRACIPCAGRWTARGVPRWCFRIYKRPSVLQAHSGPR